MFYKVQLLICLLFFGALGACVLSGGNATKLTAKDAGSTIYVKQGEVLEVTLEGNPTTGYTWEEPAGAGEVLAQQGEPEFKADSSALGSGGMMTLRFKAMQAGTYPLKLIYHRTFEPNVPPLQTYDVTIVVEQ